MGELSLLNRAFGSMAKSPLQGGTITFTGSLETDAIRCTTGSWEVQQVLRADGGGFSPMLFGVVSILLADLPTGQTLHRGQCVTVTPNTGPAHAGKIYAVKEAGPLIELTIHDQNQGA